MKNFSHRPSTLTRKFTVTIALSLGVSTEVAASPLEFLPLPTRSTYAKLAPSKERLAELRAEGDSLVCLEYNEHLQFELPNSISETCAKSFS